MDFSFLSTHESSICYGDKTQSFSQSYDVDSVYNDYCSVVEYQPDTKVVELCSEFKDITKKCSEDNNYLKMIQSYLGSLSQYLESMLKHMNLLPKNNEGELYLSSVIINNEIKTWKLIHEIYEDRFNNANEDGGQAIARHSELELIRDMYKFDTHFREAQIVVDWLELYMKGKVERNVDFVRGSYGKSWEHTKHAIQRKTNFALRNDLDPDAPLRGDLILSDSDKNDENEYLRYLYNLIQSGDCEKAQILCQNHEELWRALSLEGWRPFHNASKEYNTDIIGNPNRSLFKSVGWDLSEDTQLNIYERAIYAIFCGNISVLSLVEKDWDGLLWAHFKVYIEHAVDNYLNAFAINGLFGTQSIFGDDNFDFEALSLKSNHESKNLMVFMSREQIFDDIASKLIQSPLNVIRNGNRTVSKPHLLFYKSIFGMVQQFIILNDVEGLISHIEMAISKFPEKNSALEKLMLRFLTHVVIFLYSIHVDMKMDSYHKVLEQYIACLIEDRSFENISFYVSKLSTDLQIKWYCIFMDGVTDYIEKKRCINDGLNNDLPIVEISRIVVRNIRLKTDVYELKNTYTKSFLSIADKPFDIGFVTDFDKAIINSLDWLTFLPEQYCHLIRESNALCRMFLENDKLHAMKMALNKISKEITLHFKNNISMYCDVHWLPAALYENQCYKAYIASYDSFGEWYCHFFNQKPAEQDFNIQRDLNLLSFQEKQSLQKLYEDYNLSIKQWENVSQFNANKVLDMFVSTLRMGERGWLSDIGFENEWIEIDFAINDNDNWTTRKRQMNQLQKKSIVNLSFLLMKVLTNSEKNEGCFELVNLLADRKLELWQCFEREQLQRILQQVRQGSLYLLSEGKDAVGIEH